MPTEVSRSIIDSSFMHEMVHTGEKTVDNDLQRLFYLWDVDDSLPWLPPPIWKTALWFLFDTVMVLLSPFVILPLCYLMSGLNGDYFGNLGVLMAGWIAVASILLRHYMMNARFNEAILNLRWSTPALIVVFTPVIILMGILGACLEYYLIYFFTGQEKIATGLVLWHILAYLLIITMDGSAFSGNMFGAETEPARKATLRYLVSWVLWIVFATDTLDGHGLVLQGGSYYNQWCAVIQTLVNSFFITYTLAAPVLKHYLSRDVTTGNRAGALATYYIFFSLFQYGICYSVVEIIVHALKIDIPPDFDAADGRGHMIRTYGVWMLLSCVLLAMCQMWYRLLPHYNPKGSPKYTYCRFAIWLVLIFIFAIGYYLYFDNVVWLVLVGKFGFLDTTRYENSLVRPTYTFSLSTAGIALFWQTIAQYSRKNNEIRTVFR